MIYRLPSNMRKCSKSWIVREIKATEIILPHHLWWLKWKRKEHILTIMWIKWNSFALLERKMKSHIRFPSKWEKITIWYNQTSEYILKERKERKKAVSLRYLHAHLHSMFFNIAHVFLGGWRDKQKVVYTCDSQPWKW